MRVRRVSNNQPDESTRERTHVIGTFYTRPLFSPCLVIEFSPLTGAHLIKSPAGYHDLFGSCNEKSFGRHGSSGGYSGGCKLFGGRRVRGFARYHVSFAAVRNTCIVLCGALRYRCSPPPNSRAGIDTVTFLYAKRSERVECRRATRMPLLSSPTQVIDSINVSIPRTRALNENVGRKRNAFWKRRNRRITLIGEDEWSDESSSSSTITTNLEKEGKKGGT